MADDDKDALPGESDLDTLPSGSTFGRGTDPGAHGVINASIQDDYYPQLHKKNVCHIFNNTKSLPFQKCYTEFDNTEDVERLKETLASLNFECTVHEDQTADEMYNKLSKVASDQDCTLKNVDCFLCWVITYGDKHHLYAGDKQRLDFDRLVSPFTGDRCSSLFGKPKLFFFQAMKAVRKEAPDTLDSLRSVADEKMYRIPAVADFCFLFSTPPGYFECGDENSHLVTTVCRVFDKVVPSEPGHVDLNTLLMVVSSEAARHFERQQKKYQIPCVMSTLTRHVKFSKWIKSDKK